MRRVLKRQNFCWKIKIAIFVYGAYYGNTNIFFLKPLIDGTFHLFIPSLSQHKSYLHLAISTALTLLTASSVTYTHEKTTILIYFTRKKYITTYFTSFIRM